MGSASCTGWRWNRERGDQPWHWEGDTSVARNGAAATGACTTGCGSASSRSATTSGSRTTTVERAYKVDGKALRLRKTLVIEDAHGHELAKLQEKLVHVRDSMEIEDADGNRIAMVKKALISPLRDRWVIEMSDGPDLEIKGNVVDHEYTFRKDGDEVAAVSKKWFRVADSYGVEIEPGQEPVIVLAATVAIDQMTHDR